MTATRLADRAVIRLAPAAGEDPLAFLQGLVTQDVSGPLPVWTALLTPQGKALFDFIVWPAGADVLLDCEAATAEALVRRLSMYRLRRQIAIALDPGLAVHWQADAAPTAAPGATEPTAGPVADPRLAALGQRWIAPRDAGATAETADAACQAHRLALGVTEGRAELGDGETLWLECNAAELNGVSFTKGCYVGQENTARMNWRQKVNRRLLVVPLERSDPARQRAAYPALGLAVDHLRMDDVGPGLLPGWLAAALEA